MRKRSCSMPIKHTETEIMLSELCNKTFLNLWCYTSPYKQDVPEHKECCDVIAIFENHIFIFFDRYKPIDLASETDWNVKWKRWCKETIDKQIETCYGAERYIRAGGKLYIDEQLSEELPVKYDLNTVSIHKIIVAHGAKDACLSASPENINGSLAISYRSIASKNLNLPFYIWLNKENPIHVFDSYNFELILTELDTFWDFTNYIQQKERLIKENMCLSYSGEEELLAYYYVMSTSEKEQLHHSAEECGQAIFIDQGGWDAFVKSPKYQELTERKQVSRFWDDWINDLGKTAREGKLIGNANAFTENSGLYEMAKEPRCYRWLFSEKMNEAIYRFQNMDTSVRQIIIVLKSSQDNLYYVFLQYKVVLGGEPCSEEEHGVVCNNILDVACGVTKPLLPNVEKIVGIGMFTLKSEKHRLTTRINTTLLMDCSSWNSEIEENYKERNKNVFCEFGPILPRSM